MEDLTVSISGREAAITAIVFGIGGWVLYQLLDSFAGNGSLAQRDFTISQIVGTTHVARHVTLDKSCYIIVSWHLACKTSWLSIQD